MKVHVKQANMTVCLMHSKYAGSECVPPHDCSKCQYWPKYLQWQHYSCRLLTMSQLGSVDIVGYSCVKETSVSHLTDTEHPASSSEWEWMLWPRETVHLVTSLSLICNALKHISKISIVLGMCPVSTNAWSCVVCWCCYGYAIQKGKQRWPPRPIQVFLMILFFSWRRSIKF